LVQALLTGQSTQNLSIQKMFLLWKMLWNFLTIFGWMFMLEENIVLYILIYLKK